ncbi:MAG TPA: hypothetical protein DEQ74_02945 [Wolbachia sp.]|nr:hypothetical protein [Wolbachia sp.]
MYEEWKAILSEINSKLSKSNSDENLHPSNLNPNNIVARIKELLKEKLDAQYQYIYIRWEEAEFNINYPFLLTRDNELYGTYATLLHIAADHGLEVATKYLLRVQDININAKDTT